MVDGGWGVDALLGRQTRKHDDLDIAIPHKDVPKLRRILAEKGFNEIFRDDSRECNFVLQDEAGNQLDSLIMEKCSDVDLQAISQLRDVVGEAYVGDNDQILSGYGSDFDSEGSGISTSSEDED